MLAQAIDIVEFVNGRVDDRMDQGKEDWMEELKGEWDGYDS